MVEIEKISKDNRSIQSAWGNSAEPVGATVGYMGVTKIVPYDENGEMAPVVWLAVYRGDVLWTRLNCAHVAEITYASESE